MKGRSHYPSIVTSEPRVTSGLTTLLAPVLPNDGKLTLVAPKSPTGVAYAEAITKGTTIFEEQA
jgi:hypothetical protein